MMPQPEPVVYRGVHANGIVTGTPESTEGRTMDLNTFELRPDPSGGFDAFIDGRFLRSMVYAGANEA